MTISEAISTAKRIIPYRYNIPGAEVEKAKDTVWQAAKDDKIREKTTGTWERWNDTYVCSECGCGYFHENSIFLKYVSQKEYVAKFCPECGANMTIKEEE